MNNYFKYTIFIIVEVYPVICGAIQPAKPIEKYVINSDTVYSGSSISHKLGSQFALVHHVTMKRMKRNAMVPEIIVLPIYCDQGGYPSRWHVGDQYLDVITANALSASQARFTLSHLPLDKLSDYDVHGSAKETAWRTGEARTVAVEPLDIAVAYLGSPELGRTEVIHYACFTKRESNGAS